MSWLSNHTLERLIHQYGDECTRDAFHGVMSINLLPLKVSEFPWLAIVNTQTSNLPGEHWICLIIDSDGHGEVFDSMGRPPPSRVAQWMNTHCRHNWNYTTLVYQTPGTAICGAFVLYVILHRLQKRSLTETLRVFSTSTHLNNELVTRYFHKLSRHG